MEHRGIMVNIFKGLLRSILITLIGVFILSLIMMVKDVNLKALGIAWVIITCISIFVGAIYSAKKNQERGWLVGLILGLLYYIILFIFTMILKEKVSFVLYDFYRLIIALAVGFFSGMLGINT
ncbi:TIGR04086 family membrane protein [Inconstantimicrobium mannanitabidum]|uniref:Membrane protein n=1 Tax=Inconstantimicrobium mannanitabidum TaxID=1604901 RepID=A0ACB5RAH4_9CLOT|nr:TIGR04086 family membrane protein [Clostridium sp. TW13]GKX66034.1 membrane protein [Clostridium sp. TW13]